MMASPAEKIIIAIDVDGCLRRADDEQDVIADEDVRTLIRLLAGMRNTVIVLWSGSGPAYARQVAQETHVAHWVNEYGSKTDIGRIRPDVTIDDQETAFYGALNLVLG